MIEAQSDGSHMNIERLCEQNSTHRQIASKVLNIRSDLDLYLKSLVPDPITFFDLAGKTE